MSVLGSRIKARRELLEMTQEELAQKLGYKSRSTINKIEMGVNDIPQSKIPVFAKALDCSIIFLMMGDKESADKGELKAVFESLYSALSKEQRETINLAMQEMQPNE